MAVTLVAAVVGPVVGWSLRRTVGGTDWFSPEAEKNAVSIGFVMVWVAGLSHLFADMLSAPDIAEALEPFWPLYRQSLGFDIVWYNNPWFNWGLLVTGIILNFALYYRSRDSTTRSTPLGH